MENAERMGTKSADIAFALPFWGSGDQYNYGIVNQFGTNLGAPFQRNTIKTAQNQIIDFNTSFDFLGASYTFLCGIQRVNPGVGFFVGQYSQTEAAYDCGFYRSQSSGLYYYPISGVNISFSTDTLAHVVLGVTADGTNVKTFTDGRFANTLSDGSGIGSSLDWRFGGSWNNESNIINTRHFFFLAFSVPLSDDKIAQLSDNPWQLWQPRRPVYYSISAAPTLYTLPSRVLTGPFEGPLGGCL
ncbi:MAG: hypothetical protein JRC90_10985 [Deltaproteobacteria bacterium]|nr:hypothetical protein [Deltaproteobacteria bacterium]